MNSNLTLCFFFAHGSLFQEPVGKAEARSHESIVWSLVKLMAMIGCKVWLPLMIIVRALLSSEVMGSHETSYYKSRRTEAFFWRES
jgi:hypothetical protein